MFVRNFTKNHEFYLLTAIILIGAIITVMNPNFLSLENIFDLLRSYSFLGILSVGAFVVLISGGIDISFTAIATIAQYLMALAMFQFIGNIALAILLAAAIGILLGSINASIIYFFKIPTIIVSIATLNIFNGFFRFFSRGNWIYNLPEWFSDFSNIQLFHQINQSGVEYGLSLLPVIWILIIIITWFILQKTMLGRGIYAMGGDPQAAARCGFPILILQMFVYCYMGMLAGIAGVIHALQVQTIMPNAIVGKELSVLAAVVLGGTSLSGGRGTLLGTFLGITLLAIMSNGLTLMRIPAAWNDVLIGLIIIISVGNSAYRIMRKRAKRRYVDVEEK